MLILDKLTEKAKDVLLELSKNNSSSKDARNGGQVRYIARRNMDTQSIRGIIRVVEPK